MAEDRMLNDEILLGLIKSNSGGGGGGGTTNYNQLENKPQIAGTELKGNKSLADLGIASASALANKVDKVEGKGLSTNDYTDADKAIVGGVTAALSDKVDKVEGKGLSTNDYSDTEKAQVATNASDISSLKSGLTNLDNEVNGDATVYPYADVITINDAVPANLADCSVKVEPVQDLHGYDKPWVGGAGKNKLPLTLTGIKTNNVYGTWNDNVYTLAGVTYTVYTDDGGNVTGIKVNGTYNGSGTYLSFWIPGYVTLPAGTYVYSSGMTATQANLRIRCNDGAFFSYTTNELTKIYEADTHIDIEIVLNQGDTVENAMLYPMIRLSTEQDATFAPYTNICPISGHTEAVVTVADDETDPTVTNTYTLALGDTYYKGLLDVDTGVFTSYNVKRLLNDPDKWISTSGNIVYKYNEEFSDRKQYTSDSYAGVFTSFIVIDQTSQYTGRWQASDSNYFGVRDDNSLITLEQLKTRASAGDLSICYELATPFTIQLTPQQIQLLKGTNTITASTGQISVTTNGVNGAIGAVQEQVNGLAEEVAEIKPLNYSTTEQKTGQKWIDGRDVYIRTFDFSSSPVAVAFNNWTSLGVTITNCDILLRCNATQGATNLSSSGLEFEVRSSENYGLYAEYNQNINMRAIKFLICEYVKKESNV